MVISKEYQRFLEEAKTKLSPYEKACNFAEKILKIRTSPATETRFESAIRFCYLNISSSGPISLVTILFLISLPTITLPLIFGLLNFVTAVVSFVILISFLYYLYSYPFLKVKVIRARASTEMILATLYMAVSLRDIPNLENAIRFAAENATGIIALDLKKIIWDLETQKYYSIGPALEEFLEKWGKENEEFVDTVKILQSSVAQPVQQRLSLIDEAIDVLLSGTIERMKHYALNLRLPVMLIYSMGIVLPIISLIIFPIIMIFLQEVANVSFLVIGYDLILPIFLFWMINTTLERKPPTFSQPQLGVSPTTIIIPTKGGIKKFSVWTFILPFLFIFLLVGGCMLYQYSSVSSLCKQWQQNSFNTTKPEGLTLDRKECGNVLTDLFTPTLYSSLIIWDVGLSVGITCFIMTLGKLKLRERVRKLEREFREALFQLGHQMSTGHSVETALEKSRENLKNLEIATFYDRILYNITTMGMTFENAVFDENYGAIKHYPSDLIRSIMRIIVDASKKGLLAVSTSALTISKYLKGMHQVEEQIQDIMSEVVTSMKFLAIFLAPLVAGITVAMAIIILNVLVVLSLQFTGMTGGIAVPSQANFLIHLWKGGMNISPDTFQLVLGIYVIQTSFLLGRFINSIESGEDQIGELNLIGKLAIFATIIYTVTLFITYMMFGGVIATLLVGVP